MSLIIAFIGLIILVSLHELGHFLTAKKFGVKVEEFGIGYPPRLIGKQFGDTLYSLNLLPFGAFVKIPEEPSTNPSSFFAKPLWQRALIIFNGAAAFWAISAVLFSFVYFIGAPTIVNDEDALIGRVQISAVSLDSPAQSAGLKAGDVVLSLGDQKTDKVKEVQDYIAAHRGEEIVLTVERGKQVLELKATPRVSPPSGQGALGIGLVRTAIKRYPWYEAPLLGLKSTFEMTLAILEAYKDSLVRLFQKLPTGLELMGPVGIVGLLSQGVDMGLSYFLQMIGVLSINVAILNLLPIPAFDGGKLFFLGIEAVRKKPVSQKLEQGITTFFFILLLLMMALVTFKDIKNLF